MFRPRSVVVLEHQPFSNSVVLSSKKAVGGTYKMSRVCLFMHSQANHVSVVFTVAILVFITRLTTNIDERHPQ